MGWNLKCGECCKWYLETEHRQKDLCENCRATLPITRKVNSDRIWISKQENIDNINETN